MLCTTRTQTVKISAYEQQPSNDQHRQEYPQAIQSSLLNIDANVEAYKVRKWVFLEDRIFDNDSTVSIDGLLI